MSDIFFGQVSGMFWICKKALQGRIAEFRFVESGFSRFGMADFAVCFGYVGECEAELQLDMHKIGVVGLRVGAHRLRLRLLLRYTLLECVWESNGGEERRAL